MQWTSLFQAPWGPERTVLIIEVSSFQGLKCTMARHSKSLILVPVACVHNRGVPAIQGSGHRYSTIHGLD